MAETTTSILGAVLAGFAAAGIFAVFARLSTLNVMNMVLYLSTLHAPRPNVALGWGLHFALGSLFGLIYAGGWAAGIRPLSDFYVYGLIGGTVHWLVSGWLLAGASVAHAGIRAGAIPAPGAYMSRLMGKWGFIAGLAGHLLFGLVFAYIYQFFIYYR